MSSPARARMPCDVVAGNNEVPAPIVLSADHDMAMRMTGIEVIRRDPVHPRAKIGFHLPHQVAHERFEVGEFGEVLRRHDKAKLVTVALASFGERLTVGAIAARIVKLAGSALTHDAIALHVPQMRLQRACIPRLDADDPRLDGDPALACRTAARRHRSLRMAAADARAGEIGSPVRSTRTRFFCDLADALDIADGLATAAVADPSKSDPKFILGVRHGRTPSTAHPCGAQLRRVKMATCFVNIARPLAVACRQRLDVGDKSWMCRQRLKPAQAPVLYLALLRPRATPCLLFDRTPDHGEWARSSSRLTKTRRPQFRRQTRSISRAITSC